MIHYVIAIIMAVVGIILTGYELILVIRWFMAEPVEAIVVDVETRLGGILIYHYDVFVDEFPKRMAQKIRPLNPLKYFLPKMDVGKRVTIKYNRGKECLFQHFSFGISYFVIGLILLVEGLMMLAIFWLVP